jgi:hypothetical protein
MKAILLITSFAIAAASGKAQITNFIASPFHLDVSDVGGTQEPFVVYNNQAPSVRYQQVYQNADFLPFVSGPVQITELTFSSGGGTFNANLANVQIDLSTTAKQPDGLSTTFSQNVGGDDLTVFSGPMHLVGTMDTYGVHIPLQRSFPYNPAVGNLLVDVRNFQTLPVSTFVFGFLTSGKLGDSTSIALAADVNSPTALLGTAGLLTEFTVVSVPEPSSTLLLLGGMIPLGLACRRRARIGVV